jgi:hypothetical protein
MHRGGTSYNNQYPKDENLWGSSIQSISTHYANTGKPYLKAFDVSKLKSNLIGPETEHIGQDISKEVFDSNPIKRQIKRVFVTKRKSTFQSAPDNIKGYERMVKGEGLNQAKLLTTHKLLPEQMNDNIKQFQLTYKST